MPMRTDIMRSLLAVGGLFTAGSRLSAAPGPAAAINAAQLASVGDGHGVPPCSSCHGTSGEGNANAGFPRLAGLPAEYLQRQLGYFAGGQRQDAVMMPIAKVLTADEAKALADYYSHLPAPSKVAPLAAGTRVSDLGKQLALRGRWADNVPACTQCHGEGGVGVGADFPALAGQSSVYLVNQLQAWQKGTRDPGPMGLMGAIAGKLSDAEVHAVADYFSQQPPATTRSQP